jgi:hypothetical protein
MSAKNVIGLLAFVSACTSAGSMPATQVGSSPPMDEHPQRPVRTARLLVPAPPSAEERFAKLVPEFAGAYRGAGNVLVIRVTDLRLSHSGGPAGARALLQADLNALGRPELTVEFELAKYEYSRLQSWIDAMLDSLGAYHAISWGIDQRTSQIRVGLPDTASQRRLVGVAVRLGIPTDALVTSIESTLRRFPN